MPAHAINSEGSLSSAADMTGARNGRLLKILVAIGVLLFCGFLGYHQHATRLELQEAQRRFGDLHRRHDKLANEWKGEPRQWRLTGGLPSS